MSAWLASGAASASIAQQRSALSSFIRRTRRRPARRGAVIAAGEHRRDQVGRVVLRAWHRARSAIAARATSARIAFLAAAGPCPCRAGWRMPRPARSRSLPTKAWRNCQASVLGKVVGVGRIVDRRIKVDHRSATRRRRARRRRTPSRAAAAASAAARAPGRRASCGEASLSSRSGRHHPGRGRRGRSATRSGDRPGPTRWSPRAPVSAPAPTTFSASARSIPPIRP